MGPMEQITASARAMDAIAPLIPDPQQVNSLEELVSAAVQRGHFTPGEDDRVRRAFHDFLTARAVVHQAIADLRPLVFRGKGQGTDDPDLEIRAFAVAYSGACLLVRVGRALIRRLAPDATTRRKLDEPCPERGIPAGQLRALHRRLTSPRTAWRLKWARDYANAHRPAIDALGSDAVFAGCIRVIAESESALDVTHRRYLKGRLRFLWDIWRRGRASTFRAAMFGMLEVSGRVVARMRLPGYRKRVNGTVQTQLAALLQPGDVIVTRHHDAMSNLFLPGYWPHAALHIGTETQCQDLTIEVDQERASRWQGAIRVLEARKDGVRFRALDDTLAVDAVVVIRPMIDAAAIGACLSRALENEGKLYDFGFDFFRSDRIVCTEVVYRTYDGTGPIAFELTERAGRPTLSAEDLLDLALEDRGFQPVAIFGTPDCRRRLVTGEAVRSLLRRSYRE